MEAWDTVAALLGDRPLAVFLDFDGTLSPIVDQPDAAELTPAGGPALDRLAALCPVAIVSGRDLQDARRKVGVESLWYAGSHGFELCGPQGQSHEHEEAGKAVVALADAERQLKERLGDLPGAIVENKRFALAAHYRMVAEERAHEVTDAVDEIGAQYEELRVTGGRKVAELRPDLEWDKGKALHWLLERIAPGDDDVLPIYAGDDLTDEDALAAIGERGFGVVVVNYELGDRPTSAHVSAGSPEELCAFLERIADLLEARGSGS
jgi:trehalose-phosphatase